MPTQTPQTQTPQKTRPRVKAVEPAESVDWLALWALSLGLCAIVLAAIAYFTIGDKVGASFILAAAAGIIGAALQADRRPRRG
jgi:hypothetical protein